MPEIEIPEKIVVPTVNASMEKHLKKIQKAIQFESFDKREIVSTVDEIIQMIRERKVRFNAYYYNSKSTRHYKTFTDIFRKIKARQINLLQEIQKEMKSHLPNQRYCLNLIQLLFKDDGHERLQRKMGLQLVHAQETSKRDMQLHKEFIVLN